MSLIISSLRFNYAIFLFFISYSGNNLESKNAKSRPRARKAKTTFGEKEEKYSLHSSGQKIEEAKESKKKTRQEEENPNGGIRPRARQGVIQRGRDADSQKVTKSVARARKNKSKRQTLAVNTRGYRSRPCR
jgi:hypothetical protein